MSVTAPVGAIVTQNAIGATANGVPSVSAPAVQTPVAAVGGFGPGTILAASSYGSNGTIWDVTTSGSPRRFADVGSAGWVGGLVVATSTYLRR